MRAPVLFALMVLGGAAAQACEATGQKDGMPIFRDCPKAVTAYLERAVQCQHYAGEFGGDQSFRDKLVIAKAKQLRCDELAAEKTSLVKRYEGDTSALRTMEQVAAAYRLGY